MIRQRVVGGSCAAPFPVYEHLAETLAGAHQAGAADRDPTVAHVLGTCAGYAYADTGTVATMMTRIGLARHACVRISETVDAMLIFSTAYVLQSECGRIVIVCYRGTEPGTFGNWLGDADMGTDSSILSLADAGTVRVHAGFHRNVRATWWPVLVQLTVALRGRSLLNHRKRMRYPLQALYVTGHSLGGAMATLFALSVCGSPDHRSIADRLRAVYTFGQPMAVAGPLPKAVDAVAPMVFRHVTAGDPIPALPPKRWGPFQHIGHEYRHEDGQWRRADSPTRAFTGLRQLPRSLLAFLATEKDRASFQYTMAAHGPHHYLAALRPPRRVTEFGDFEP